MSPFDHPSVKAAVERESEVREAAFLGLPFYVEGIALPPLTLRHFLTLRLAGNAFLSGGEPVAADVAMFLYVVTGQTGDRAAYAASLADLDFVSLCRGILEYKAESLFDRAPKAVTADDCAPDGPAYWSEPADLVDVCGREYGWTREETMNAPIAVLLQLLRIISRRTDPKTPMFNPLSDLALVAAPAHGL